MLTLFAVLTIANAAMAQIPSLGSCPETQVMNNFDAGKYMGKWYEAERYFTMFEIGGKCVTANYSLNDDGTIKVINQQISYLTGTKFSIEGSAKFQDDLNESRLDVSFQSVVPFGSAPLMVLDTDYRSYAVVWSCTSFHVANAQFVWILTRERMPDVSVMEKAYRVLDKNRISKGLLMRTDQKNCPDEH